MKWLKKITDKIGYAPTLMLAGAVLPLAVFGAGELLSLILANLGFFHLKAFAMTISTGLTWGVIWPVMIGLSVMPRSLMKCSEHKTTTAAPSVT